MDRRATGSPRHGGIEGAEPPRRHAAARPATVARTAGAPQELADVVHRYDPSGHRTPATVRAQPACANTGRRASYTARYRAYASSYALGRAVVGFVHLGSERHERRHGVRDRPWNPTATAARIAAPVAVVSTEVGDAHRQARHVGLDLPPQRTLRAAAHDREPPDVETGVAHRVEDVAQRERAALEDRARHVVARVREREPVEHASGGAVPLRRHRALHAREEHEPLGAGGDVPGLGRQEVVGVAEPDGLGVALDRGELVPPPAQVPARDEPRVLEEPRVGIGVRVALDEHRRVLAWLGARRADRLRGADDVADIAGLEHAGAERRGHLVAAPDRHRRSHGSRPLASANEPVIEPTACVPAPELRQHRRRRSRWRRATISDHASRCVGRAARTTTRSSSRRRGSPTRAGARRNRAT